MQEFVEYLKGKKQLLNVENFAGYGVRSHDGQLAHRLADEASAVSRVSGPSRYPIAQEDPEFPLARYGSVSEMWADLVRHYQDRVARRLRVMAYVIDTDASGARVVRVVPKENFERYLRDSSQLPGQKNLAGYGVYGPNGVLSRRRSAQSSKTVTKRVEATLSPTQEDFADETIPEWLRRIRKPVVRKVRGAAGGKKKEAMDEGARVPNPAATKTKEKPTKIDVRGPKQAKAAKTPRIRRQSTEETIGTRRIRQAKIDAPEADTPVCDSTDRAVRTAARTRSKKAPEPVEHQNPDIVPDANTEAGATAVDESSEARMIAALSSRARKLWKTRPKRKRASEAKKVQKTTEVDGSTVQLSETETGTAAQKQRRTRSTAKPRQGLGKNISQDGAKPTTRPGKTPEKEARPDEELPSEYDGEDGEPNEGTPEESAAEYLSTRVWTPVDMAESLAHVAYLQATRTGSPIFDARPYLACWALSSDILVRVLLSPDIGAAEIRDGGLVLLLARIREYRGKIIVALGRKFEEQGKPILRKT